MAVVKLSSPWIIFYREIQAMFKYDNEVHVIFDEDETKISLYVDNATKAEALAQILPTTKEFGSVVLKIEVIPANTVGKISVTTFTPEDLFSMAFENNPALSYATTVRGIFTNNLTYVIFAKEVVQFFDDNIGDFYGMKSTLYQDIAKDIFTEQEGVFFCTEVDDSFGKSLVEWP